VPSTAWYRITWSSKIDRNVVVNQEQQKLKRKKKRKNKFLQTLMGALPYLQLFGPTLKGIFIFLQINGSKVW
jgi:hypothetical protein